MATSKKNVETVENASEGQVSELARLEDYAAFEYVYPPAALSKATRMRFMAVLSQAADVPSDDMETLLSMGADLYELMCAKCVKNQALVQAFDESFADDTDALEFTFSYAGAVGELYSSKN